MADIAAGNVTYTMQSKAVGENSLRNFTWKLAFGNGALTYPAGGIPLTKASLGCPNEIRSLKIYDDSDADGVVYKYDFENNKIRIYQAPAQTHAHNFTVTKGAVGSSLEVGLSADAAAATMNNNTIASTLALTTNSPVASRTLAAAALAEYTGGSTAVAATVLYCEVTGW